MKEKSNLTTLAFQQKSNDEKIHRIERSWGTFERSFRLPENADKQAISAEFKDGVLKVNVPKKPVEQAIEQKSSIEIK